MLRLLALLVLLVTPAMTKTTIAIVGLRHSHVWSHIGKMVKGQPATLVGVAETNDELIAEAAKEGVASTLIFRDYRKMLDEKKPDIVWAFVPNDEHRAVVEECARRKIHVMLEKPLAATYEDALAIQRAVKQSGIYILTNYQMAWWPAQYTAKKLVESGAIGTLWRLHGIVGHGGPGSDGARGKYFFEWLTDPVKNGGGALMDFGCYNALWSLWYLGPPTTVYAHTNQLRPERFPKVEDNSDMVLSYKNGVGLFEGSWDLPRSFQQVEIFGRTGSVLMRNGVVELRKGNAPAEQVAIEPLPPERAEPIAYMVHCIEKRQEPDGLVGLELNLGVNEIIEAAKQSVRSTQAIKLPMKRR